MWEYAPTLDMQISESEDFSMRNKRIITILLAVVLLLCVVFTAAPSAEAAGNYTIRLADSAGKNTITAKPGDTVKLILSIENNPGIISVGAEVKLPGGISLTAKAKDVSGFSDIATTNYQPSPLSKNPYLMWWVMPGGDDYEKLVTKSGKLAELSFKIADDAMAGEYKLTLNAPADKNQTRDDVDSSGKILWTGTNKDITGIAVSGCTIKVESTCANKGHDYGPWQKVDGSKHSRTCKVADCRYVETKDHTWNGGTVTKKPSCTQTGTTTYTCTESSCGATKTVDTEKTAHSYSAWKDAGNDKHTRKCTVCSDPQTANHTWNSGTVTKKATCKETGIKTYTCTACNAKKTEEIKLSAHTYENTCDADCNVCGETRAITHKYKTSWSKNKNEHWYACSVCGDKKDAAAHTPGPEATETKAQKCTECGYTIKAALSHKCKFAETWTTDEIGHWHACSGCDAQDSYAEHNFENACDPDCSVCGYTRQTAHKYGETYLSDEINHWYECTGCGDKQEIAAHESGPEATETTAQTCTVCGYEIAPALGGGTEPTEAPTETPTESDKYDAIIQPDIIVDIPWGIIFAVVGAGALTLVIILLVKKKRY